MEDSHDRHRGVAASPPPPRGAWWVAGPVLTPPVPDLSRILDDPIRATPDAPALVFRPSDHGTAHPVVRWTYAELDEQVQRLVHLFSATGVRPHDRVAVVATRRLLLVPSILALLRLGATYVPLDPTAPDERWRTVLREAEVRWVVGPADVSAIRAGRLDPGTDFVDWDTDPTDSPGLGGGSMPLSDPEAAAYVLFTSGSTGVPKGVVVSHRNVVHRIASYIDLAPGPCRYLLHSSLCFDGAVGGLYSTLARGGCLVLVTDDVAGDPGRAAAVVRDESVTHLEPVPSWYAALLECADPSDLASVRVTILGGEVLPPELAAEHHRLLPRSRLFNDYGPTEATVAASVFEVLADWSGTAVPIGRPHANTALALVGEDGGPVGDGEIGELVVGGPCVASGYLRPSDQEGFRTDPVTGERTYRTGDLARWASDGQLHFHGRRDRQVKIRGQRVEPEELEAVLRSVPGVGAAAVDLAQDGGDTRLIAYVAAGADGASPTPEGTLAALAVRLPTHLLPAAVVVLDTMPLTPGGKIDRRALSTVVPPSGGPDGVRSTPRDGVEAAVLEAFEAVLQRPAGLDDDFFSLGGQSLAAARVASRVRRALGVELTPGDLLRHPSARALAGAVRGRTTRSPESRPTRRQRPATQVWRVAASARQQSFWYLESLPGGKGSSNLVECLQLPRGVGQDVVGRAVQALVDRHASLRTSFELTVDGLQQVVRPRSSVSVTVTTLATAASPEAVLAAADLWGARPFDLAAAPLLRAACIDSDAGPFVVLVVHHAVADGWSVGVLLEELVHLMDADGVAGAAGLPEPTVDAVDLVEWAVSRPEEEQRSALEHAVRRLREAAGSGGRLLPYDRPASARVDVSAGRVQRRLPPAVVERITQAARALGVTPYHLLTASLGLLLARAAGTDHVVIGGPVSGRGEPELDRLVGCCINTGLFRVDASGDPSFATVARRVAADAARDERHAWLPLEVPLRVLSESERAVAVPVLLNLLDLPGLTLDLATGKVTRHSRPSAMAYTDLDLYVEPVAGALLIDAVFARARLDGATVEALLDRWLRVLDVAVQAPEAPVSLLPSMTADEEQVLAELEGAEGPQPVGSVLAAFRERVEESPHRPLLVDEVGEWTRQEVWDRSYDIATVLVSLGAGLEDHVVLALDGTGDLVAALLACWRIGSVAVPVGETLPSARLAQVVASCRARVVVDQALLDRALADGPSTALDPVSMDRPPGPSPAYVIFTSGSTGEPKGVVVSHAALFASTAARVVAYRDRPETALVAHDPAFDAGLGIITWYLVTGGRLILARRDQRLDPELLADLVERHGVGQLDIVPSPYRLLLDCAEPARLSSLRLVTLGGEACPPGLVAAHLAALPHAELVNEYGPTECTVWALSHTAVVADAHRERVPIGVPVQGVVARVADRAGLAVPPGHGGELLLSGHLLAQGYLGRPDETTKRFVEVDGRRWYRTGDRARWTGRREVEFLGRLDSQVKVRGFRIELEEVEQVLAAQPGVVRAAVGVRELVVGAPVLVAWVQRATSLQSGPEVTSDTVRARCLEVLPEWSVPSVVVVADALVETTAGKLDRDRLPLPDASSPAALRPPTGVVEQTVADIWQDLLGRPVVDRDASFFALGGQSLLAARMVARVRQDFQVRLSLADFLVDPSLRAVAGLVEAATSGARADGGEVRAPAAPFSTPVDERPLDSAEASRLLGRLDELSDAEVEALLALTEETG